MPDDEDQELVQISLRRLRADGLVIYTADSEARLPAVDITIDDDELVYNPVLPVIGVGIALVGLVVAIGGFSITAARYLREESEREAARGGALDGGTPAPAPIQVNCVVEVRIDAKGVVTLPTKPDAGPTTPDSGPSVPTASPTAPDGGTPTPTDPLDIAPSDVMAQSNASQTFEEIMDDYLVTTFADAESAAAYLQQQIAAAGIEVQITDNGYMAIDRVSDPGQVTKQLHSRGVTDKATVDQARSEANSAILAIEGFVQQLQSHLPAPTPEDSEPVRNPFAELVTSWTPLIPGGYSYSATSGPPQATDALPTPAHLLTLERELPCGVTIQADIVTAMTVPQTDTSTGYEATPFISVFDTASQWHHLA